MTIYLVLTDGSRPPSITRSLRAARRIARKLGAAYLTPANPGEWYGYETRADMHMDRHGGAPYLIRASIDRVTHPEIAISEREYPETVLSVLRSLYAGVKS
jgi:hypothetical protein